MLTPQFASLLLALLAVSQTHHVTATPTKLNRNMPEHASLLSEEDAVQLGRLARLINFAQCPSERHLQPTSTPTIHKPTHSLNSKFSSAWTQPRDILSSSVASTSTKQWGASGLEFGSDVVYTSHEVLRRGRKNDKKGKGKEGEKEKVKQGKKKNGGYVIAKPAEDLEWLISHNPQASSLTLAMSSLPTAESFLALIEEEPLPLNAHTKQHAWNHKLNDNPMLIELPSVLFPEHLISQYAAFSSVTDRPMMHSALLGPLLKHGPAILVTLLELIDSPPQASTAVASKRAQGTKLFGGLEIQQVEEKAVKEINKVTISGHGLGADLSALIALSLQLHMADPVRIAAKQAAPPPIEVEMSMPKTSGNSGWLSKVKRSGSSVSAMKDGRAGAASLEIDATFFGMSRIGNQAFAAWVDALIEGRPDVLAPSASASPYHHQVPPASSMKFTRVSSYADLIPHLPSTSHGFQHFSSGEVWVDGDPRTVWECSNESPRYEMENSECGNSIQVDHTSLLDHAGPYFDVWVGSEVC